ncbi:hypothetical protein O1M54_41760 [Streptomyces diastatochromogenes]|nr:hypothetical protein [Streptomyces diastatochromogenes]
MGALTPESVEELLGDPADPGNPYGFAAAVARDEADAHPTSCATGWSRRASISTTCRRSGAARSSRSTGA